METQETRQIRKVLDTVVRRRGLIIISIMIAVACGLGYYLTQPKSYEGKALLSYQQQKINPTKMSPAVQAQVHDTISTLYQIVTSRTSLEKIINDINLYVEERDNLPMEDVVDLMRENISIEPSKQADIFHITFTERNPKQVARVTNAIAARFIEENLKYREELASETSIFTQDELETAKVMIDRKEAVMRDYKLKYYNEMPDQRSNNMSRLNALQEQYQGRQNSVQDLERTRVLVQDQMKMRKEMLEENERLHQALTPIGQKPVVMVENDLDRLERLQAERLVLLEKYTKNHSSVRQLQLQIATIKQKLAENPKTVVEEQQETFQTLDTVLFELELQLKQISLSIEKHEQEMVELKADIVHYKQWVAASPVREAEWSALTREYGELKRHYDYLVSQNLQARSALNIERKQKGSQFKIEDPARAPKDPVKPDFLRVMAIALLAGCALGGGLAFCLEFFDNSFRDPSDLEDAINAEVICSVPLVPLKQETKRKRLLATGGLFFYVLCGGLLISLFFYFWQQGRIVI